MRIFIGKDDKSETLRIFIGQNIHNIHKIFKVKDGKSINRWIKTSLRQGYQLVVAEVDIPTNMKAQELDKMKDLRVSNMLGKVNLNI